MRILGIETSCDETAIAVVEGGRTVHSNVISSSKAAFAALAGVIPEEAARRQVECILPVTNQALKEAGISWKELDAIAVTRGPGLLGSLLVGTMTARVLASLQSKPLIGVHHTLGHLSSTWLGTDDEPRFPVITLSASGGHTDLWYRTSHTMGTLLGRTRDDAAGETFDKGASMLGLPYPGGPTLSAAAKEGNERAYKFPLPLHGEDTLDFSFSGLKTSLKYLMRDSATPPLLSDVTASFQFAICRHLCDPILKALYQKSDVREVHLVGGVSANSRLRSLVQESLRDFPHVRLRWPTMMAYCTDNGAMIAAAGEFLAREHGVRAFVRFSTEASLPLAETVRNGAN